MPPTERRSPWKLVRSLLPPMLVVALLVGWLGYSWYQQVHFWQEFDEYNLREWLDEASVFRKTLPELVRDYLELHAAADRQAAAAEALETKADEIREHLRALASPLRMHEGLLPLFPEVYRIELEFAPGLGPAAPLAWDSHVPRPQSQNAPSVGVYRYRLLGEDDDRVWLRLEYQLHAFNKKQQDQRRLQQLTLGLGGLVGVAIVLAAVWVYSLLRRERQRELQRLLARQQIEHAEKLVLENELRRQEAETKQQETERQLLQQSLKAAAAERQALELKSQFYASIGIMAGSYAHNIKNLLVRPNDLIRRCLETDGLSSSQGDMLHEVRETLGTVTERLQQILRTVRRDPSKAEMACLDLTTVVSDIYRTWADLARDKWKLTITTDLADTPLPIDADLSHLQQAVENLLFNARDATFEMRNHMRERARSQRSEVRGPRLGEEKHDLRQALIAAAAWRGEVVLRTRREDDRAVLEVQDNGIGMTEVVRRRCTETHFSTKRDNALYEGYNAGMGLGLSFVTVILEHHRASLVIESEPLNGALFRVSFPLAAEKTRATDRTRIEHG